MNVLSCTLQVCDEPEELQRKVSELAAAVRNAKHLVIYTGAGISTVGLSGVSGCSFVSALRSVWCCLDLFCHFQMIA